MIMAMHIHQGDKLFENADKHTLAIAIHSTRRQRKAVMKTRTAKPMSSQTLLAKSEIGTNPSYKSRQSRRSRFRSLSLGSAGAPQVKHLLAQALTVSELACRQHETGKKNQE